MAGDISAFVMRIVFFPKNSACSRARFFTLAIAAVALAGPRGHVIPLASGGTLRYSTQRNRTLIEIRPAKAQVLLGRDETVAPGSPVLALELLAQKPEGVYVITDRYASRPGPMSYCQAGQEQFVRVLARARGLHETFSLKVQSCRSNLELGPAGLSWDNASSTLTVDGEQAKRYRVAGDGRVTPY
jgi:hypothetical protein